MTQTVKQPVSKHAGFSRRRSAVLPHLGNFFLGPIYQALTGHRGRLRTFYRRAVANGLQHELVDTVLKQSRNREEMPHLLLSLAQDSLEKALYWGDVGVKARARDHYLESALLDIFAAVLCSDDSQNQKIIARGQASYLAAAPHFACPAQPVEIGSSLGALRGYMRFPVPGSSAKSDAEEQDEAAAGDDGGLININHPCVILFNGISSPKEELHFTENALLAAGLATLSFDYPGELSPDGSGAGLCGDIEEVGNALWLYATSRPEIDVTRLALYGTSIGGRLALYTALKFPERFRCIATLSAPYDLLADLDLLVPAMRREFAARPSCTKEAIFDLAQRTPLRNLLPTMSLPLLVAGGTKDVIAMSEESRLIYELSSSSDKKLIVCSSAGHNCYEMMPSLRHEISTWDKAANVNSRVIGKAIIITTVAAALVPLSAAAFNAPQPIKAEDYFKLNGSGEVIQGLPSGEGVRIVPVSPELRPAIPAPAVGSGSQDGSTGRGVKRKGTGRGASTSGNDGTTSGATGSANGGTAGGAGNVSGSATRQSSTAGGRAATEKGKNSRGSKTPKAPTGGLSAPSAVSPGISGAGNPGQYSTGSPGSGQDAGGNGAGSPGVSAGNGLVVGGNGLVAGGNGLVVGGAAGALPLLTVTQSLNEGLLRSPRVAAVRSQLEISKALYTAATQMPNPVLLQETSPIAEQSARFGSQATIEPPWKIAFRLLAAKRQVQQVKSEILRTLWLFRNDIRRAYTETVVAEQAYETLSDLSDLSKRLMDVSQKRFQAGDVPELDVMKARLAAAQADVDKQQGFRRTMRARQQLNVIMGRTVERPLAVPKLPQFQLRAEKSEMLPDFDLVVPPMRDFIDLAMTNRLELKILKQQVLVARAQLYGAIGNIIPNPQISSGHSYSGNPATGPGLNGYFMGVNMELPLFTTSQGDIARLRATVKQYQNQYHAQENQIIGEVSAAYNNLLTARERIQVYQTHVLAESQEVARLARLSYEVGQSDITSTLAAQQANIQTRSLYLDAVTAYQQAFTDLEQAVGEPLQ